MLAAMSVEELERQLHALIGTELGAPTPAEDPVNQPMIRHLAVALEDANPVYTDLAVARSSVFGEIVAPPAALPIWTMTAPPRSMSGAPPTGRARMMAMLDSCGFTGIVVNTMEQTYLRPLRVGDLLTSTLRLAAVSPRKRTVLGEGYFLTEAIGYVDQQGAAVGEIRRIVLKYRPQREMAQ
jgi:hypothetical protein